MEIFNKIYNTATVNFNELGVSVVFKDFKAEVEPETWEKIRDSRDRSWVYRWDDYRPGDTVKVIREIGMGDVLFTTPGVAAIAKTGAKVYYHTAPNYFPLLKANPDIAGVNNCPTENCRVVDLRHIQMDFDFTGNRSDLALKEMFLKPEGKSKQMVLVLEDHVKKFAEEYKKTKLNTDLPVVLVEYEASTKHRTYPHMIALAEMLSKDFLVLISTSYRRLGIEKKNIIDISSQVGLEQYLGIASVVDYIIGNDSGTQYLGQIFGKPTLALYGVIDPALRVRDFPLIKTIFAKDEGFICSPCNQRYQCGHPPTCLKGIPPERVAAEFYEMTKGTK